MAIDTHVWGTFHVVYIQKNFFDYQTRLDKRTQSPNIKELK